MALFSAFLSSAAMLAGSASALEVTKVNTWGVPQVLVYSYTAGFRHDSIPTAIDMFKQRAGDYGVEFTFTEDPTYFVDDKLAAFDSILFLQTSEEVLNWDQQGALQRYFQSGGNWVGVHCASSCLRNDTSFQQTVGAQFDYHPLFQQATFMPIDKEHPSNRGLPDRWTFEEEVYMFKNDPRDNGAKITMTVDDSSYNNAGGHPTPQGSPHPIAWYIEDFGGSKPLRDGVQKSGRSFYTSLGHSNETWNDELFIGHFMNGLVWALDSGNTKAYGQGLVGKERPASPPATSSAPTSTAGTAQKTSDAVNAQQSSHSSSGQASSHGSSQSGPSGQGGASAAAASASAKPSSALPRYSFGVGDVLGLLAAAAAAIL